MAKKSKNKKTRTYKANTAAPAKAPGSTFSSTQEFSPDYTFVMNDLKRIGFLAAVFFVILVGISFVI